MELKLADGLAYPSGTPVDVDDAKAKKYIEDGIAIKATDKEVKDTDGQKENAASKKNAKKETANKK